MSEVVVEQTEVPDKKHSFHVQINYKSGISVTAWFDKFNIKARAGELTEVEWKLSAGQGMAVIHIGVDQIESIIQLGVKEID